MSIASFVIFLISPTSLSLPEKLFMLTSGIPPVLLEITGTFAAIASKADKPKLSISEAKEIIQTKTNLTPISVGEISKNERGSEYRGRPLPLFKIESLNRDRKVINVYLDPYSGQIRAIRSTQWRIWDFLWGLHIMDWTDRDNFNNNFIKFFSVLAFISALSGILLFFKTRRT